ncbi:MAG: tRNA preQ1(34) S-adenosylmethionine ribosyltransferase-isomerase QueA [Thermotoga sp.]|nr:MAG: tRNA preQ1(34) S-adenosylmethionine ribosyltransferase-isomerase QueA [Thermotoga sp.]
MRTSDFDYTLPKELIAQTPMEPRDAARLMVINRKTGQIEDRMFHDLIDFFTSDDMLILNESRVIPARLYGRKSTGGKVEILLLNDLGNNVWRTFARPGKRIKRGTEMYFNGVRAVCKEVQEDSSRIVEFLINDDLLEILPSIGTIPIPPYIKNIPSDPEEYQTVYSRIPGSVAAPTAGLHFTGEMLDDLEKKGVRIARITLHVGEGTFKPVKTEKIEDHEMHSEFYSINEENARKIREAIKENKRITAVGTTTTRVLETLVRQGEIKACSGWTDIFIYPPYEFKCVDALITNFHLPKSTLLMLVCAFASKEMVLKAYSRAIEKRYRFFSFGDACLFL